jgi:hypothetical protein
MAAASNGSNRKSVCFTLEGLALFLLENRPGISVLHRHDVMVPLRKGSTELDAQVQPLGWTMAGR